jgi:hypothetical protein
MRPYTERQHCTMVSGQCPRLDPIHRVLSIPHWPRYDYFDRSRSLYHKHNGTDQQAPGLGSMQRLTEALVHGNCIPSPSDQHCGPLEELVCFVLRKPSWDAIFHGRHHRLYVPPHCDCTLLNLLTI